MPGSKAMGVRACLDACRFVRDQTPTRTVVDPFCGWGTALAVANALGLDAIGVDLSARMCRRARALEIDLETETVRIPERPGAAARAAGRPSGADVSAICSRPRRRRRRGGSAARAVAAREVVCVCSHVTPLPTRTRVVLLQHPREHRVGVGTARLAHLSLPASSLHVGLDFDGDAAVCAALASDAPTYVLFPGRGRDRRRGAAARSRDHAGRARRDLVAGAQAAAPESEAGGAAARGVHAAAAQRLSHPPPAGRALRVDDRGARRDAVGARARRRAPSIVCSIRFARWWRGRSGTRPRCARSAIASPVRAHRPVATGEAGGAPGGGVAARRLRAGRGQRLAGAHAGPPRARDRPLGGAPAGDWRAATRR